MKHIFFIATFLICALLFTQCKKPGCFSDSGAVVTMQRPSPPFQQIDLQDNVNLVLTQDAVESIHVEAGEGLQGAIETKITDGVLTIKNTTDCQFLRSTSEKVTAYVAVKNLLRLNYSGSGNITTTNTLLADGITFYSDIGAGNMHISLDAKRTYAYLYGNNTDMVFTGKSDSCYAYTGQRGTIDFRNFVVKYQQIGYGSIRDGYVHATESLHVLQYFRGTLFYKGRPPMVKTEYFSTGKVLPID